MPPKGTQQIQNLSSWRKIILKLAFKILRAILASIGVNYFKDSILQLMMMLEKVVNVLTDEDPNNREQLLAIWKEHQEELEDASLDVAIQIIKEKVDDEGIREMLIKILTELKQS